MAILQDIKHHVHKSVYIIVILGGFTIFMLGLKRVHLFPYTHIHIAELEITASAFSTTFQSNSLILLLLDVSETSERERESNKKSGLIYIQYRHLASI